MMSARNRIMVGDARRLLRRVPTASVDCIVTSPPYFRLRSYGHPQQLGLEPSVNDWVDELRAVMKELARILKPSGSLWLNLGDTYASRRREGALPKSLLLGPERLALAMSDDGWIMRNKIIWHKTNTLPTSVRDRLACKYEVLYFATRARDYYFDLDAIRLPHAARERRASAAARRRAAVATRPYWAGPLAGSNRGLDLLKAAGVAGHPLGRNPGDVWVLPTSSFRGAHHATFPPALIERPLMAGCPEKVCSACGMPWLRQSTRHLGRLATRGRLLPQCQCQRPARPGVVLDPFFGAGTVGLVAERLGREWIGVELNPDFAQLARERIERERAALAVERRPMAA